MQQDQLIGSSAPSFGIGVGTLIWLGAITLIAAFFLPMLPASSLSEGTVTGTVVGAVFVILLAVSWGASRARASSERLSVYRPSLLIWWFLLIWEVVFERLNEAYNMTQGQFGSQAYGEAAMWVLAFFALMILSIRWPGYLHQLFSPSFRWVSVLVLFSLLSIVYAPGKAYSGAWGLKLLVTALLLQLCANLIQDLDDIVTFLKVTAWAYLVLSLVPVVEAFLDPAGPFEGGRLNADPDWLSPVGGILMLLALILSSLEKKRRYLFLGLVGTVVMFLAFGKAGIAAGILAGLLFLALRGQFVKSVGLLLTVAVIGLLIVSFTPIAGYLHSYEGAGSLTGRIPIWTAAIKSIKESPYSLIWGHGYLATYFAFSRGGAEVEVMHLHNAFLEVGYNNGLLGIALLLLVNYAIIRSILATLRRVAILRGNGHPQSFKARLLTVGLLALYVNLLLGSFSAANFGGRPRHYYMLFLAIFALAAALERVVSQMLGNSHKDHLQQPERPYSFVT